VRSRSGDAPMRQRWRVEDHSSYWRVLRLGREHAGKKLQRLCRPPARSVFGAGQPVRLGQLHAPDQPGRKLSSPPVLFAGTSAASAADDAKSTYLAEDFSTINDSGCLAPAGATNNVIEPVLGSVTAGCSAFDDRSVQECSISNTALIYPTNPVGSFCHAHQSMADILDAHGIRLSWTVVGGGDRQ